MKKIWMNGCFDVLHYGHFKLIEYAKSFDGKLVIGIDSDERVKYLKGMNRPFHTQEQRRYNLMQIKGVDAVITFDSEDELRKQIQLYSPDIFVIGSDYIGKPIIGGEYAKEIKFYNRIEGLSTTKLLDE
jgi:rfaE bifunctional protein nucleotidyltransferase chain/domain